MASFILEWQSTDVEVRGQPSSLRQGLSWLLQAPVLESYGVTMPASHGVQSGPHTVPMDFSSAHFSGALTYYYSSSFCKLREWSVNTKPININAPLSANSLSELPNLLDSI